MDVVDRVLALLNRELVLAEHELETARTAFSGYTAEQLEQPYWDTGGTCKEALQAYAHKVNELHECIAWVNNH